MDITDLSEYLKHTMLIHFSLVVVSLAFLLAIATETQTIRTKAEEELNRLRLAIDTWNQKDRIQLRKTILAPIRSSPEYKTVVQNLNGWVPQSNLISLLKNATTIDGHQLETLALDIAGRIKDEEVLKLPTRIEGREASLYLIIDPIACTAGRRQAQILGDLEAFWSDLVSENVCNIIKSLKAPIEFPEAPPEYVLPVYGALAYQDVMVLAHDDGMLDVPHEKADPHKGGGAIYPLEVRTILIGARDETLQPYKAIIANMTTYGKVEVQEIKTPPLLRYFDTQGVWIHAPFDENFPALFEVTKNYPKGIQLAELAQVMRLEARRDEGDVQTLGLTIPRSALTAFGMPAILGIMLYFSVTMLQVHRLKNINSEQLWPSVPWIGIYDGFLARTLLALSAIGIPLVAQFAGLMSALERQERPWEVGIALICLTGTVLAAVALARTHRRLRMRVESS